MNAVISKGSEMKSPVKLGATIAFVTAIPFAILGMHDLGSSDQGNLVPAYWLIYLILVWIVSPLILRQFHRSSKGMDRFLGGVAVICASAGFATFVLVVLGAIMLGGGQ
jgi:hypothetical protein